MVNSINGLVLPVFSGDQQELAIRGSQYSCNIQLERAERIPGPKVSLSVQRAGLFVNPARPSQANRSA